MSNTRPQFERDHPVYVMSWANAAFLPRHFSHWPDDPEDPGIFVYAYGRTSFTGKNIILYFQKWKDAEAENE